MARPFRGEPPGNPVLRIFVKPVGSLASLVRAGGPPALPARRRFHLIRRFQTLRSFPRTSSCPAGILRENRRVDFKRFKFKNFLVGLGFCVISGALLLLIPKEEAVTEYVAYHRGVETPCTIIETKVRVRKENGINREVAVRFRYEVSGKSHDGTWAGPVFKNRSATEDELVATLAANRPGSSSRCRVNPDAPSEARLHADFPWKELGFTIFVSGFFLVGLYLMISSVGKLSEPTTSTGQEKIGRILGFALGLLFVCVGYGMLWKTWENRLTRPDTTAWVETPCVIEAASVRKIPGGRVSYKFEVLYSYTMDGKAHRGFEIRPGKTAVSVSGERDALVSYYAPGARVTCRVDSKNHGRAVLEGPVDESGDLTLGTTFFGFFAAIGTWLTFGCAIGPSRLSGKGYQKFSTLLFTGGFAVVIVTTAILVPNIHVQGISTDSWLARGLFGLFGVVVAAVVARRTWRTIDETPETPLPKSSKGRGKGRRRRD